MFFFSPVGASRPGALHSCGFNRQILASEYVFTPDLLRDPSYPSCFSFPRSAQADLVLSTAADLTARFLRQNMFLPPTFFVTLPTLHVFVFPRSAQADLVLFAAAVLTARFLCQNMFLPPTFLVTLPVLHVFLFPPRIEWI
jgi:hypothetical protein